VAVANAVADALGREANRLPLTPERVLELIEDRSPMVTR
jgi:CO/xanthine dehydrogenase Mo-binding subunit